MYFTDDQIRLLTRHVDKKGSAILSEEERDRSFVIADATQPDMPIIFMSEQFKRQTGFSEEDVIGQNCRFLQGPETDPGAVQAIGGAIASGNAITLDILNYKKDGNAFWNRLRLAPIRNTEGAVTYYLGSQNPIESDAVCQEPQNEFAG